MTGGGRVRLGWVVVSAIAFGVTGASDWTWVFIGVLAIGQWAVARDRLSWKWVPATVAGATIAFACLFLAATIGAPLVLLIWGYGGPVGGLIAFVATAPAFLVAGLALGGLQGLVLRRDERSDWRLRSVIGMVFPMVLTPTTIVLPALIHIVAEGVPYAVIAIAVAVLAGAGYGSVTAGGLPSAPARYAPN